MNNTNIKILIGYHKPATLIKDDVFVPIHLGRALATEASKDGKMSQEDYQWMLDNMIGDDTGDNISNLNRYLCEMTALYWAWKNYDKLGNPEYFGFMHYRRHLSFSDKTFEEDLGTNVIINEIDEKYLNDFVLRGDAISEYVTKYDIIVSKKWKMTESVYEQFSSYPTLHSVDYDFVMNVLNEKYPDYSDSARIYNNSTEGWFTNVFVMKKDIFFKFAQWMFNILLGSLEITKKYANAEEARSLAHISERLMGIFMVQFAEENKTAKIKEVQRSLIEGASIPVPINKTFENEISVVMSCDDKFAPYLCTTIKSLVSNSSECNNYGIYVLDGGISKYSKQKLAQVEQDNVKIRYIDISSYVNNSNKNIFYTCEHFQISTYYRFYIPQIFSKFNKLIYCDCDSVFLGDVASAYNIDIGNNLIGAVKDTEVQRIWRYSHDNYFDKFLGLKNPLNYFQAGFLIMNIDKMKEENFTQNCVETLLRIKTPKFVDQCILNIVCEDKVKFIDNRWNVEYHLLFNPDLDKQLPKEIYDEYMNSLNETKFLHFSGNIKPWQNPSAAKAELFWKYARQTEFYEEIIYSNVVGTKMIPTIESKKKPYKLIEYIFSIKNDKSRPNKIYKVITILGLKFKLRKKSR